MGAETTIYKLRVSLEGIDTQVKIKSRPIHLKSLRHG